MSVIGEFLIHHKHRRRAFRRINPQIELDSLSTWSGTFRLRSFLLGPVNHIWRFRRIMKSIMYFRVILWLFMLRIIITEMKNRQRMFEFVNFLVKWLIKDLFSRVPEFYTLFYNGCRKVSAPPPILFCGVRYSLCSLYDLLKVSSLTVCDFQEVSCNHEVLLFLITTPKLVHYLLWMTCEVKVGFTFIHSLWSRTEHADR